MLTACVVVQIWTVYIINFTFFYQDYIWKMKQDYEIFPFITVGIVVIIYLYLAKIDSLLINAAYFEVLHINYVENTFSFEVSSIPNA